eukprot:7990957-Prorocentrum_lima.AAC.1
MSTMCRNRPSHEDKGNQPSTNNIKDNTTETEPAARAMIIRPTQKSSNTSIATTFETGHLEVKRSV